MEKLIKMATVKENKGVFELEEVISVGESYLTRFLEVYGGREYENGELLEGVIKVCLSKNNGLNQLLNGIEYDGNHYEELVTTPSGMKKESDETKGESLFYNVDTLKGLKEEFYKVISADKLKELEGKEIAINKMVSSRLALATSTIEGSISLDINRVCVVDEYTYDYLGKYSWFENGQLVEGERKLTHTFSDGQGLMSNEFASRIQKGLKKDYQIEAFIERILELDNWKDIPVIKCSDGECGLESVISNDVYVIITPLGDANDIRLNLEKAGIDPNKIFSADCIFQDYLC